MINSNTKETPTGMAAKLISASSEESRNNAARQMLALKTAFTGNPKTPVELGHLAICAAFNLSPKVMESMLYQQASIGVSKILIILNIDNPTGLHLRFDFIHVNDWSASYYKDCALWMPQSGKRTMIVPDAEEPGFFSFKVGHQLSYHHRELPGPFESGNQRAMDRFYACLAKVTAPDMDKFGFALVA